MTQQEKDKLNKQLCGLLGICWHEEDYLQARHCNIGCSCGFITTRKEELSFHASMSNPDFTSEAGRVQLLKLMMKIKNYENFGDLWFLFACWDDKENKVYAVPTKYLTNDNGAFARAAREFLKAMEVKP